MLRAGLRGKRLRLSDDDRRRLAVKAQALAARRWPRLRLLPHPLRFCAGTATSSQPSTMAARTGAQADLRTATEGHRGWSSVTERFKPIKNGQGNDDERDMPVVSKNTNEL